MRKLAPALVFCLAVVGSTSSAAPNVRSVGICHQIAGPGPHITKAFIAVSSGDKAWDQRTLVDVIGMRVPAPMKYVAGTWLSVWISDPSPVKVQEVGLPHIDCAKAAQRN
jgi:hypothetical protein